MEVPSQTHTTDRCLHSMTLRKLARSVVAVRNKVCSSLSECACLPLVSASLSHSVSLHPAAATRALRAAFLAPNVVLDASAKTAPAKVVGLAFVSRVEAPANRAATSTPVTAMVAASMESVRPRTSRVRCSAGHASTGAAPAVRAAPLVRRVARMHATRIAAAPPTQPHARRVPAPRAEALGRCAVTATAGRISLVTTVCAAAAVALENPVALVMSALPAAVTKATTLALQKQRSAHPVARAPTKRARVLVAI